MTEPELFQIIQSAAKKEARELDLAGHRLTFLPPAIEQLIHLETLILGKWDIDEEQPRGNKLKSLPPEIGSLKNLKSLNLSYTEITELPPEIGQLSHLQTLKIHYSKLSVLPPEIGRLVNLENLDCSFNNLSRLPPEMGQLYNLKSLNLRSNNLIQLPSEIGQLTNLKSLNLRENQLSKLPRTILQLLKLHTLDIQDNLLPEIPPEIGIKGWKAILSFYDQLEQSKDYLYEAKLIIIGEAGAGKTSLAKKIQDQNYLLQHDEVSTEGIDVIQWYCHLNNGKEFRVNIWDFGGQEIYHSTHQFFLTKRSLYALVVDTRKEDTDFYYWLRVVELLSNNSPLLIVKNEKQDRQREINERQLRGEFTHLKDILATNLATNRGLSEILTTIQFYLHQLPHVGTELPKTWVQVREVLEQDPRNYISLNEYFDICTKNGFTNQQDKLQLSGYLHDLGVCLHFQEDDLLNKTVILKPTWGTDAVYKVLDNKQVIKNLGKFDRTDLATIWHEDRYATMRPELLRLMMNFKLCYEIPSCPGIYIAPQLLSPNQPEYAWDKTDNLFLNYEYEFTPKGILTRFIVEMHPWIEEQTCVWRSGVVLNRDETRAEVIEYYRYHKGEIRIRLSGKRRRDLLTIIRHEFEKIYKLYERLKYKTLVPCNCKECNCSPIPHFYPLNILHKFLEDKQYQIQCQVSYQMVSVQRLVNDFDFEQLLRKSPVYQQQNAINEVELQPFTAMSDSNKYSIKADVVQIIENNPGEVIAKKYAADPGFAEALTEITQILKTLQQNHPTASEAEAQEIIEAEFEEIRVNQPTKWQTFRRQLLNRERWLNGGKAALSEAAKHYVDNNVFYKTGLAFLDGFSASEPDDPI
ncbi:COR domain-containing protein [Anabaena sp. CCY 0017]|uniref:COR domain-containing protein n=1 Tax=Anabaena sp. CCY 0017 TaxID=3103866 RepID=UPI0039C6029D